MLKINHIKAYLLGLLVGGGKIDKDSFIIDLPFNKWGMNPQRMNNIAVDILTRICQNFNSTYNFNVTYEIGNNKWLIKPIDNANISALIQDLAQLELPTSGFLLSSVDLTTIKSQLVGISVESFLSGIFDTRASLTLSHRRFNDDAPVVSIEIPGSTKNFKFVVQLCSWLTDLGSITDQILYNHPNQHSGSDPSYKGWKKGFKIRFLVKSFLAQHSFALQSKSSDITQIKKGQKKEEQNPCYLRELKKPSPISIHNEQNSNELPIEVKNKLFFHYHHFCAVLGCQYAPIDEIKKLIQQKISLINFFPILSKGARKELEEYFLTIQKSFFPDEQINKQLLFIEQLLNNETFENYLGLNQGIAYLFSPTLKGKRHEGSMNDIINNCVNKEVIVTSLENYVDSPLLIINSENNRAFICSSVSNKLNQELIAERIRVDNLTVSVI